MSGPQTCDLAISGFEVWTSLKLWLASMSMCLRYFVLFRLVLKGRCHYCILFLFIPWDFKKWRICKAACATLGFEHLWPIPRAELDHQKHGVRPPQKKQAVSRWCPFTCPKKIQSLKTRHIHVKPESALWKMFLSHRYSFSFDGCV